MKYLDGSYSRRKIHIGLIAKCEKDSEYGLLYGFRNPQYNGVKSIIENKIFFFKKYPDLEIQTNTLVSYLSYDYDKFSALAEYVFPISSIVKHHDLRDKERDDNNYHDDETWKLINEGKPFFDYQCGNEYCIYYPIVENNVCTVWRGLWGCGIYLNKEAKIYEMNEELNRLNYSGFPSFEEISKVISEFRKYIESINANAIIDTFEINKICSYQNRPGKDDHYTEYLEQKLQNDDKYLSFLLPDKHEIIFYDNNAYPSDGYISGVFLQKEDTMIAREKAKDEYTKDKHLSFLIYTYLFKINQKRERSEELKSRIYKEFDIQNAEAVISKFEGNITEELISLIDSYNNNTTTP